jgi:hypothetical protein
MAISQPQLGYDANRLIMSPTTAAVIPAGDESGFK